MIISQACQYFRMAMNKDYIDSYRVYGVMFENGWSVLKNVRYALDYYQKAIDKGSVLAATNLATVLFEGDDDRNLKRNISEAARLFKSAADGKENISRVNYGYLLKNGIGVLKNYDESCRYLKLAADDGDVNAMIEYAKLLEERKNIGNNQEKARDYYQMAADKNNINDTVYYQKIHMLRYIAPVKYCEENIIKNRNDEDESLSSLSESDFENTMDRVALPEFANENSSRCSCICSRWMRAIWVILFTLSAFLPVYFTLIYEK